MQMLLCLIRIVPGHFLLESSSGGVVIDPAHLRANDAFQGMKHRPGSKAVQRTRPLGPFTQVYGVVVSVCEPKPKQQPPRRLESETVDEFLPQQSHRRRTENDHTLLVQANDPLIRPKVEQFRKVQICGGSAPRHQVGGATSQCAFYG